MKRLRGIINKFNNLLFGHKKGPSGPGNGFGLLGNAGRNAGIMNVNTC